MELQTVCFLLTFQRYLHVKLSERAFAKGPHAQFIFSPMRQNPELKNNISLVTE